jgi:2-methylisocitrate lyase-like PEP mutase family enzyme
VSVPRVAAAVGAARASGIVLTARCENLIRGVNDVDATIARLIAYRDAGADVVYAPGLVDTGDIARVVDAVAVPVNVLILPGGPNVGQLTDAGVRRISIGSGLSTIAYAAVAAGARELLDAGTIGATTPTLDRTLSRQAWS